MSLPSVMIFIHSYFKSSKCNHFIYNTSISITEKEKDKDRKKIESTKKQRIGSNFV